MTGKELIKLMKKNGWVVERIHGSHYVLRKNGRTEVVPLHGKELPKGLESAIRKRCGF